MRNVIYKSEIMSASPDELFNMYLDPAAHAAFTGAPVVIGDKSGSAFQAFDGGLTGTILQVVRPRLVIQSWRSFAFKAEDPDSTLIICFTREGDKGRIDLVHLDVPDHDYDKVTQGWEPRYFAPWRRYLESR